MPQSKFQSDREVVAAVFSGRAVRDPRLASAAIERARLQLRAIRHSFLPAVLLAALLAIRLCVSVLRGSFDLSTDVSVAILGILLILVPWSRLWLQPRVVRAERVNRTLLDEGAERGPSNK